MRGWRWNVFESWINFKTYSSVRPFTPDVSLKTGKERKRRQLEFNMQILTKKLNFLEQNVNDEKLKSSKYVFVHLESL